MKKCIVSLAFLISASALIAATSGKEPSDFIKRTGGYVNEPDPGNGHVLLVDTQKAVDLCGGREMVVFEGDEFDAEISEVVFALCPIGNEGGSVVVSSTGKYL